MAASAAKAKENFFIDPSLVPNFLVLQAANGNKCVFCRQHKNYEQTFRCRACSLSREADVAAERVRYLACFSALVSEC